MKRIATAAVAASLSLTAVVSPAFAAEDNVGSSAFYKECKVAADEIFVEYEAEYERALKEAKTDEEKAEIKRAFKEEKAHDLGQYNSSTPSGVCIKYTLDQKEYKDGMLALLIGVPLGLVALLGAAAAFSGAIPGVNLPF